MGDVVTLAVLIGVLGYAIGNYAGVGMAFLLRTITGKPGAPEVRLASRTAAILQSAPKKAVSYAPESRFDRTRSPDHPFVAPKVGGSSPVGHPPENRLHHV